MDAKVSYPAVVDVSVAVTGMLAAAAPPASKTTVGISTVSRRVPLAAP